MSTGRRNVMLGTAGHVDHGKTALVKLLTGCNTDRLAEEQRRGLTIDLGYAPCRLWDERIVGVVDVPGHVDFIRNMVAGAHGIDVVILVVAANDGVMPQTREHLDILTLLGVRHGLIALTKIDLVDAEMQHLAEEEVRRFVTGTFLEHGAICPLSTITAEGFDGFYQALNREVAACEARECSGLFRMWISSAFSVKGFGAIVTGIPSGGSLHVGDRMELQPHGGVGRIRRLEVYGEETTEGRAGECVACNVTDLPAESLTRGSLLCANEAFAPVTMAEAELRLLDTVGSPLKDYSEVHLHVGTAEAMAKVAVLDDSHLHPGRTHFVQLRLDTPLAVAPGDRFVIRAGAGGARQGRLTTIGGGRILGASNLRLRRHRPWTLETLAVRQAALGHPTDWCALILKEAGTPLTVQTLARQAQMPVEQVSALLPDLLAAGTVKETPAHEWVHHDIVRQAEERLEEILDAWYEAHPLSLGMEAVALLQELKIPPAVFELAVDGLLIREIIERQGAVLGLCSRTINLSPADQALRDKLESVYRQAGLCPPAAEALPALLRERQDRVVNVLSLLIDAGTLLRISPELIVHQDAVEQARKTVIKLFVAQGHFTTMEFRDALGVSRKYAVPLLDYFDQQRLTVRNGNVRTPGAVLKKR